MDKYIGALNNQCLFLIKGSKVSKSRNMARQNVSIVILG